MELQDFFYLVASIALAIFAICLLGFIYFLYRVQKFIKFSTGKIDFAARNITDQVSALARNWGRFTAIGLAINLFRKFIRR